MPDSTENPVSELVAFVTRHSPKDGVHATTLPGVFLMRHGMRAEPSYGMYKPSFCLVLQGAKQVWLGPECFTYTPADYLVAAVNLPVIAQVTSASPDHPYLGFKLEFTPDQVLSVLRNFPRDMAPTDPVKRAMFVSRMEPSLFEAVIRLVRLLNQPADIPVLAPLITQEILYRVLQGSHGAALAQIATAGSAASRINDVIDYLMHHFAQSLRIEDLADRAHMSVSSLHRHFKAVTAMSPIQFQKNLRLQEARRLLVSEATDAADVAFRVGYESPSQFSREYTRMFGLPPRHDIRRLRAAYDPTINE